MKAATATTPSNIPCDKHDKTPKTVYFLITGASRGFGKSIVHTAYIFCTSDEAITTFLSSSSSSRLSIRFVLVARSAIDLKSVKDEVEAMALSYDTDPNQKSSDRSGLIVDVDIRYHAMDLSDLDNLDTNLDILLGDLFYQDTSMSPQNHNKEQTIDRVYFINNHGSLGHLGPCIDSPSLIDMRQSVDLNVTSCLWMSVRFARCIASFCDQSNQGDPKNSNENSNSMFVIGRATIVNISSLIAVADSFPTMAIYGAGKASRDKYHSIIAREMKNIDGTIVKTLNYAPGPLETDMTTSIRSSVTMDKELQSNFQNTLLDPDDSALKLLKLLFSDGSDEANGNNSCTFESGSHIDYYDLPGAKGDDNR